MSTPPANAPANPADVPAKGMAELSLDPSATAASATPVDEKKTEPGQAQAKAQVVTPFDVSGGVDESGKLLPVNYDKLVAEFGATPISPQLLERFERVTGRKPHRFLRRGIVFSHRDLGKILDRYEKGQSFFLYTGRGPSSDSMHVGHAVPFTFTRWLQDVFDAPLVIMLSDDEKYLHSGKIEISDVRRYSRLNAADIIGLGFDAKKTFIFSNLDFVGGAFYENMCRLAKRITLNSIKGTFGFNDRWDPFPLQART
ncbi:hypothetical protein KEM52_000711 [Ascosphaera acerosa]|nr:hypothetical protein KEM52_000711 [Ascosphaera acerosa]